MSSPQLPSHFPEQTPSYILSFQFSSWYPHFSSHSIKSSIIRPLSQDFQDYLDADSVIVPEGSEDVPAESALSDDEDNGEGDGDGESGDSPPQSFAFPELDKRIRECVKECGAVFPKLNFSSPKDASWILPASSPLKCTSPSDVYLLLKSSDFINHDLSAASIFTGCTDSAPYELELVLRKWYPIERSQELRCFVRRNILIAISQRDTNYYDFLNELTTRKSITSAVQKFWETNIRDARYWESIQDYTFDFLLTRDLSRGHILDFNPYAPRTDPLLFTYEELTTIADLRLAETSDAPSNENIGQVRTTTKTTVIPDQECNVPEFRVVDSRAHPAATSTAPAHQHNMVPFEALSLSSGNDIEEFANLWKEEIQKSIAV